MKSEKLNSWLSVGANFGVVVGLFLLIFEIRQNTEMMEAQMHQSRTETAMSQQQAAFNSDFMPAIEVKVAQGEQLSDEEMVRYEASFRSFNRNMDNQLWQERHGFLESNIPRSVRGAVQTVIGGSQLGLDLWDQQKHGYTDEYIMFVDEALADLRGQGR